MHVSLDSGCGLSPPLTLFPPCCILSLTSSANARYPWYLNNLKVALLYLYPYGLIFRDCKESKKTMSRLVSTHTAPSLHCTGQYDRGWELRARSGRKKLRRLCTRLRTARWCEVCNNVPQTVRSNWSGWDERSTALGITSISSAQY